MSSQVDFHLQQPSQNSNKVSNETQIKLKQNSNKTQINFHYIDIYIERSMSINTYTAFDQKLTNNQVTYLICNGKNHQWVKLCEAVSSELKAILKFEADRNRRIQPVYHPLLDCGRDSCIEVEEDDHELHKNEASDYKQKLRERECKSISKNAFNGIKDRDLKVEKKESGQLKLEFQTGRLKKQKSIKIEKGGKRRHIYVVDVEKKVRRSKKVCKEIKNRLRNIDQLMKRKEDRNKKCEVKIVKVYDGDQQQIAQIIQ